VTGSLRLASLGLALPDAGGDEPVMVGERLVDLVLHRDRALVEALARQELAALDTAKAGTQDRLADTLLAWLAFRGERQRVADALHIHPQTVAYRMTTLRELFGDALIDPDRRFALELALRSRRAVTRSGATTSG
jgi:DNA-binding PucR family transcriptional regulator